jgi:sulfotransferase
MKRFVPLSGLPRCGSTLLSAILSQNPMIHAEGNSAICQLMWDVQQSLTNNCGEQIQACHREQTAIDLISSIPTIYYKNNSEIEQIIVDKCRSWTMPDNISLLKNYIDKDIKMIVLERPLVEVVNSFVKLNRKNNKEVDVMNLLQPNTEPIMRSFTGLQYAKNNNDQNTFLFISYDNLINNTEKTIHKIYQFCDWPPFKHDFTNIIMKYKEDDTVYGLLGMHDIENKIITKKTEIILSEKDIEKCNIIEKLFS